jgi:hypothetical protein
MTTIPRNGVSFVRNVCYCKIIEVFTIFNLIRMPVTPISLEIHQKYSNGVQKVSKSLICSFSLAPIRGHDANSGQTIDCPLTNRSLWIWQSVPMAVWVNAGL